MRDLENAKAMLALAKKDLKAICHMQDPEAFDTDIYGFHAQQAIEKSLKAWLGLEGVVYPKTHDLEELFMLLSESAQTIPPEFKSLQFFSDFAVQFRYTAYPLMDSDIDRPETAIKIGNLISYIENLL